MAENIGIKITQLREEKQLSLNELAEQTSIHPAHLELIEKGELSPSVASLVRITRALGTRLGTLLDGEESRDAVITPAREFTPTINVYNGNTKANNNMNLFSLAQEKCDRNMEPFYIQLDYKAPCERTLSHHEGEEFLYVLDGTVEVTYGKTSYLLKKGDSIYFDSIVPHAFSTPAATEKALMLAITYTPV